MGTPRRTPDPVPIAIFIVEHDIWKLVVLGNWHAECGELGLDDQLGLVICVAEIENNGVCGESRQESLDDFGLQQVVHAWRQFKRRASGERYGNRGLFSRAPIQLRKPTFLRSQESTNGSFKSLRPECANDFEGLRSKCVVRSW